MKRSIHDEQVGQTVRAKNNGNNKRYAFDDFSDEIRLDGKRKKEYKRKFYDDMETTVKGYDLLVGMKKAMRKVQLVRTSKNKDRVRCNMTHVWDGKKWIVVPCILSIKEVKEKFPKVLELMYSRNDEVYGDFFKAADNAR